MLQACLWEQQLIIWWHVFDIFFSRQSFHSGTFPRNPPWTCLVRRRQGESKSAVAKKWKQARAFGWDYKSSKLKNAIRIDSNPLKSPLRIIGPNLCSIVQWVGGSQAAFGIKAVRLSVKSAGSEHSEGEARETSLMSQIKSLGAMAKKATGTLGGLIALWSQSFFVFWKILKECSWQIAYTNMIQHICHEQKWFLAFNN